jgi:hypothetical protein
MENVDVYLLIIIFVVTTSIVNIIYGKILVSEKVVNIIKIKSKEIEKAEYTGEYMEIMIKDPSELSSYINQYNISHLAYEISKCTYSLSSDKDNFHVMDIIYSKIVSSDLNIYVVNGRDFITWEATGSIKGIRFD